MLMIEDGQKDRYLVAAQAVAEWVVARLGARRAPPEDYMEAALAELRFIEEAERSEHLWIFRDPVTLAISENVFLALEARPDGSRDWLQADLGSAVSAVARYDVMVAISELSCDVAEEAGEADEESAETSAGKA